MNLSTLPGALMQPGVFILFFLLPISSHASENSLNCRPVVEINPQWQVMRIRSHENAFLSCTVSQDKFNELITTAFTDPESNKTDFKSLFIGRLVEYPWLSRYLAMQALQHEDWDSEKGRYLGENINAFVAGILSSPEILNQIREPFSGTDYIVARASVEKVLIGKANEIEWLEINANVLVPYDVMVHFILEKSHLAPDNQ